MRIPAEETSRRPSLKWNCSDLEHTFTPGPSWCPDEVINRMQRLASSAVWEGLDTPRSGDIRN
jgi:hypothetical protein